MANDPRLLTEFRISDENLRGDPDLEKPYREYGLKVIESKSVSREVKEAKDLLHSALDEPLRSQGLVPRDRHWTLKEDEDDGLLISVWSEAKARGRQNRSRLGKYQSAKERTKRTALWRR